MISKELLSEVLRYKVKVARISEVDYNNELWYELDTEDTESINIYELAHKCKEWSVLMGYEIATHLYLYHDNKIYAGANIFYKPSMSKTIDDIARNEPEATFQATQWVYDNKKE